MAKINIKKVIIKEERLKDTTIEECLYLIITELAVGNIDDEINIKESVA